MIQTDFTFYSDPSNSYIMTGISTIGSIIIDATSIFAISEGIPAKVGQF